MDMFIVVVVFLVLEAAICAMCSIMWRERRMTNESETYPTKTSQHSTVHPPPHLTHGSDHHKEWSHASGQQPKGKDNKALFSYFPPRIHP